MMSETISGPSLIYRLSDITEESEKISISFDDCEDMPLVSLQSLISMIPNLVQKLWIVKQ